MLKIKCSNPRQIDEKTPKFSKGTADLNSEREGC